jgi:hypothetical protein
MALEWYVKRGDERSGPITQSEFEKLQEHLQATDLLWRSDWQEWRQFRASPQADGQSTDTHRTTEALLQRLIARDLMQREIAPENSNQYQYARVVRQLVGSVSGDIAAHPHWQHVLRERFNHCVALADELIDVCNIGVWQRDPQPDPRDALTVIWRHVEFDDGGTSPEKFYLDRELLSDLAHSYLLQDARSREFEYLLVDALAAATICAASRMLDHRARLGLPGRISVLLGRQSATRKGRKLMGAMVAAYRSLDEAQTHPARCWQAFQESSARGADWAPPLLAVLDRWQA